MGRGVAWTVCRSMGELGKKEEEGVFEGMGLIPQCTLWIATSWVIDFYIFFFFHLQFEFLLQIT